MMTSKMMPVAAHNDAELVSASLAGDRDAFGRIVSRYQSLVCSLAYSATGSLTASEDLAQETFVAAWKQIATLREPEKLRPWLCGIARNLINNSRRKQGREPSHRAESLDEVSESHSLEPMPGDQAISNEEAAILWRSLETIPEIYREPMVMFYREQQSVEIVAQNLELTEDAVRQRLSRGRKLLQEHMLAFVEGALTRTSPGQIFTLGVMAALPGMAFSAKAATVGAAATKGGATAGGAGAIGALGAGLFPLLAFLNLFAVWRISHKEARSDRERTIYKIFFPTMGASIIVFILLTSLVMSRGDLLVKTKPSLFVGLLVSLILGYAAFLIPLSVWFTRTIKKLRRESLAREALVEPPVPFWEYRSRFQLCGLPFIHFRTGGWRGRPVRELKPVKAWIAGDDAVAFGILFAYGSVAIAPVSIGAAAIGLLSYGAASVGILTVGGFAFGVWAFGAFGLGWQASAACAVAWNMASGGQYAIAHQYALGPIAHAPQANTDFVRHMVISNPFLHACWVILPYFSWLMWAWGIPMMISMTFNWWKIAKRRSRQPATVNGNDPV